MHFGQGLITRCKDVSPSEFKYCSDLNTTRFIQRLIQAEKPDFLAFTGISFISNYSSLLVHYLFGNCRFLCYALIVFSWVVIEQA